MHAIKTTTHTYDLGTITVSIYPDEDASPPSDEPEFFRAERGHDLHRKLESEFHNPSAALARLQSRSPYTTSNGDWYYGVTEYRHGQSAFALCTSSRARNFPDQRWDVIDLVGWIKITRQNRIDWGIHGKKGVNAKCMAEAVQCLEQWETWGNGGVVGYVVAVDGDDDDQSDSCWGYYELRHAEQDAQAALDHIVDNLGWKASIDDKFSLILRPC